MSNAGNHKNVCEYDGAFKCLDCQQSWGALPNNPKMPDKCGMGVKERAEELLSSNSLLHYEKTKSIIRDLLTELTTHEKLLAGCKFSLDTVKKKNTLLQDKLTAKEDTLRGALERIAGMSERPKCVCGITTGTAAIKSCAEQALKDKGND